MQVVHAGVALPGILPTLHAVHQWGEQIERVPAPSHHQAQHSVGQGRGEGARQHSPGHCQDVVYEDSTEHAWEKECRVVVMDIQNATHGPERYVVQGPTQEQPGGCDHSVLPFLSNLRRFWHSTLRLETGVAVDHKEDDKEDNVGPPDDRVAKQEDPGLVITS